MATDCAERAFILNTWLLIISSYVSIIFAMIFLHDVYPGAIVVLFLYFWINLLYHLAIFETLEVGYDKVETIFNWRSNASECLLMIFLWPIVYCEADVLRKISKAVWYCMNGLEWLAVIIKVAFMLLLISFVTNVTSDSQVIVLSIFAILHTVMAFYNYKGVQVSWYMIVMLGPILISFTFLVWFIVITLAYKECIKPREEHTNVRRIERERRDRRAYRSGRQNSILPLRAQDSEVHQRLHLAIEGNRTPQNMSRRRYDGPQRFNTIKAIGKILTEWKRGNSIKESIDKIMCCVWLEYFNPGEEVIELKWGRGHIFHPNCIKDWTKENKTWPVCRANVVEMAKREHAKSYQDPSVSWANISVIRQP